MPLSRFKSMYKTIIFDWDGTLHNTKALYGKAFRVAYDYLVKEGYAPERYYTDDETSIYLGMNPPDMWQAFMPDLPEDVKKTAASMIGQNMDRIVADGGAILFPGAIETLTYLKDKGYTLIILSNCRNAYMDNIPQTGNIFDYNGMSREEFASIMETLGYPDLAQRVLNKQDLNFNRISVFENFKKGYNYLSDGLNGYRVELPTMQFTKKDTSKLTLNSNGNANLIDHNYFGNSVSYNDAVVATVKYTEHIYPHDVTLTPLFKNIWSSDPGYVYTCRATSDCHHLHIWGA